MTFGIDLFVHKRFPVSCTHFPLLWFLLPFLTPLHVLCFNFKFLWHHFFGGYHIFVFKRNAIKILPTMVLKARKAARIKGVQRFLIYSHSFTIFSHTLFSVRFPIISGVFEGIFLCRILFIVPRVAKSVAITAKK